MNKVRSMKRMAIMSASTLVAIGLLSGCAPGQNTGGATLAGAAAGGLLGAAAFHGDGAILGIIGGALVGSIVGNQIGRYMDRQDAANMRTAIVNTPVGEEATWTNERTDITYTVKPVRNYHEGEHYCREYQTTILVGGRPKNAFGRACRMPDGQWRVQ